MSIAFLCAECGHSLKAADEFAGRRTRCTRCSATNTIPAAQKPASEYEEDWDDDEFDDDGDRHEEEPLLPHKEAPHEDLIDMTPMVDIVFFLLIFFLTTSMTALQAVMNFPNPQKATEGSRGRSVSELAQENDTLIVKIQDDDSFWIDDEQVLSDQDLRIRIRQACEEAGDRPVSLVVVGHAEASHGAAIRAFDAGAAAGVGGISLLVQEEPE